MIRSKRNIEQFLEDPHALAVISGIHSPPLIKHRDYINENSILTLVPWAAGGPITRYPSRDNWVFRLSVDDTKAGAVLIDFAVREKACKTPHLLLENTPWGHSNLKSMSLALKVHSIVGFQVTRFDSNMKSYTARSKLSRIIEQVSDCIILVANTLEGAEIANAMASFSEEQRIPIVSHWGITSGDFHQLVNVKTRNKIDLNFIQSCFSFMKKPLSPMGKRVFLQVKKLYPQAIQSPLDIRSPVGFIHGYDITRLLIAAIQGIALSDDLQQNRVLVRQSLENLSDPIKGLVKTYQQPFTVFTADNMDAHEALGAEDYCMAYYGSSDEITLLDRLIKK